MGFRFAGGTRITIPSDADLQIAAGDFTVAMWLFPVGLSASSGYVLYKQNGGDEEFALGLKLGSAVVFPSIGNGTDAVLVSPGLENGRWQHLAMKRAGSAVTLWVDGVVNASWSQAGAVVGSSPLVIGTNTFGNDFDGVVADMAVWKAALPDEAIAAMARQRVRPLALSPFRGFMTAYIPLRGDARDIARPQHIPSAVTGTPAPHHPDPWSDGDELVSPEVAAAAAVVRRGMLMGVGR